MRCKLEKVFFASWAHYHALCATSGKHKKRTYEIPASADRFWDKEQILLQHQSTTIVTQRPKIYFVPIHIPTHYYARTITKTLHITNARRTPSPFPLRDSSIMFMLWSKRDAQLARVELIDFSSFFIKDVFSSMLINLLF